ncbi:transcriptional regulator GcvA [Pigmentiphaga soli]|uniref:Transcriptional regulator GcvA n=1 Tax=Pigmentiphaga soli TaxID=1007095 RepID=A0ABP8HIA9_9BURK
MHRPNIPLNTLRVFEAAARLQSFEKASMELHISPSAVSQQIARLEDRFNVPLFERHHRRVTLTEAGALLGHDLSDAFKIMDRALAIVSRRGTQDSIKIAIYQTLASRWLVPQLARFAKECPEVDVEFAAAPEGVDLEHSDVDFAIRWLAPNDRVPRARRLFDERLVAVCAPAIAQALQGTPAPRSLNTICSVNRVADLGIWLAANPRFAVATGSSLKFSNTATAITAAVAGTGVLVGQVHLFLSEIEAGSLVFASDSIVKTGRSLFLLDSAASAARPSTEVFRSWIFREAARTERRARRAYDKARISPAGSR